jgi:dipeptidyl aminopeptidase/acylaminoacyl peptidase
MVASGGLERDGLAYSRLPNHRHFGLWPWRDGDLAAFRQQLTTGHVRRLDYERKGGQTMTVMRNLSGTCASVLFAVAAMLAGALRPAAMAQEEKAVTGFAAVLQRDITLWSDGTRLSGILLYPKGREGGKKLPAIVLCNGWGGTKAFLMQTGIAPRFATAGYVVINYDYRGWGDSDSRLVVRDKVPQPDKDGYVAVKAQAIRELVDPVDQQEDIDAAVSYVYGEPLVDKDRIGIWGTSFGGGHVIYRAAHDRRIACVVAQVGSMPDDWAKRFPAGLLGVYKQKSDRARGVVDPVPQGGGSPGGLRGTPFSERIAVFNPGQYAERVKVPTLLIDAEKEHYFKIQENSGRVYEILKQNGVPTEYHVLKGKAHYDVYGGPCLDDVMKLEIPWFDKHLKGAKREAPVE